MSYVKKFSKMSDSKKNIYIYIYIYIYINNKILKIAFHETDLRDHVNMPI